MQAYLYGLPKNACQLTLVDNKGEHQFSSGDIIRLQAADNYTIVYFEKRRPFIVSKVLKTYEDLLTPYGFVRTHRSHLVNKQFVKEVINNQVLMLDASVAEITKRKKGKVVRQLISTESKLQKIRTAC